MKLIFGFILVTIVAGCEGFFLEYLRSKYNELVRPKSEQQQSAMSPPSFYIPYPTPIAYGYGAGIVVEYGGQNYYIGPVGYPQQPSAPTFPYKGGPVLTPSNEYGGSYENSYVHNPYGQHSSVAGQDLYYGETLEGK